MGIFKKAWTPIDQYDSGSTDMTEAKKEFISHLIQNLESKDAQQILDRCQDFVDEYNALEKQQKGSEQFIHVIVEDNKIVGTVVTNKRSDGRAHVLFAKKSFSKAAKAYRLEELPA